MYGYIYKITNKFNGKIYIGKRARKKFEEGYWGSGTLITKAINKYGKDNFTREVLEWCETKELLCSREQFYIIEYNCRVPNGYNIAPGGEGGGIKGPEHPNYGKPMTEERKQHLSNLMSGEKNPMYGKHHTEESKKKMSENAHRMVGSDNPNYGNTMSLESRLRISAINSGRPSTHRGLVAITNGKISTYIHPDQDLPENWFYGMTEQNKKHGIADTNFCSSTSDYQKTVVSAGQLGELNSFYGKTHSEKFKESQRLRMSGDNNPAHCGPKQYEYNGNLLTVKDLVSLLGLHQDTIRKHLNNGYTVYDLVTNIKPKRKSSKSKGDCEDELYN